MAQTKSIFEVILETQSKTVENLMETSKKLTASVGQSNMMETMMGSMKDWFAKQQEITQSMAVAVKDQVITDKAPDFIKNWLEQQEKFNQQWMDAIKGLTKNMSAEKAIDFYKENADKIFAAWKKAYDQFAGMFTTSFGLTNYDLATQAKEMHDKFVDSAKDFMKLLESNTQKEKK